MAFIFFFLKKFEKVEKTVFLGLILRFSNLNVLHRGLLMQDWGFRLGMEPSYGFPSKLFQNNSRNCTQIKQSINGSYFFYVRPLTTYTNYKVSHFFFQYSVIVQYHSYCYQNNSGWLKKSRKEKLNRIKWMLKSLLMRLLWQPRVRPQ